MIMKNKIGKSVLKKSKKAGKKAVKKLKKLPPEGEIAVGAIIMIVPPMPDPSDIVGAGLVTHGVKRLKRKNK